MYESSDVFDASNWNQHDSECICYGNWRLILKEVQHLFDSRYRGYNGEEYTFFGLVHGGDDYYYGMSNKNGVHLLSCVGSIEGHGYKFISAGTGWSEFEL